MIGWLPSGCHPDVVSIGAAAPPATARPGSVSFVALGDVGKGSDTQRRVRDGAARACAALGCDFAVLLGDNLYPAGMESPDDPRFDEWIAQTYAPLGVPVYLVLGNHDYGRDSRDRERAGYQIAAAERLDGLELPANAWTTAAGPAVFFGVDTNAVFQFGGGYQGDWLRPLLDRADARWRVVFGHHPYRSNGPHGNAGAYEGWRWVPWMSGGSVRRWFEGSVCGRADLYLAGHDHNRQLLEACGVTLIVSGAAGSTTELVDRGNTPAFASAEPGAVWVTLGPERGTIAFLDADGNVEQEFPIRPAAR